ncbi:transposase [Streptomyces coffeae]|uniref:Transposase n=1 Tax=Streptomyces coffeae TaxID=621382 RepID=A0ABS1NR93_9ACTN|nr:transposase [Streptomyces coffeae]MBL1102620.1 transposase [Streptomyces coffeae]
MITDLTSRQASPERLAAIVRSQWTIENRLHFVRDTTFAEDASKVRTGHGPDPRGVLRSFAVNQLRAAGRTNIAAGLRECPTSPSIARNDPRSSEFERALLPSNP